MQSREPPFVGIGVTLNEELIKNNELIKFAKGVLIILLNTFNTFVGMLLIPLAFLLFRLLIIS